MKMSFKRLFALLLGAAMLLGTAALADGYGQWHDSSMRGSVQFASYAGSYDGYVNTDGYGGLVTGDPYRLTVISKSASVWAEPRTNSKKLGSVQNGTTLWAQSNGYTGVVEQSGFYQVSYNGSTGWVNSAYVIRNPLEIVLMESNVPAYIAPDSSAKKVGSLAKLTRYSVMGFYDDYYIISLRGGAAYIPMSVRHYDSEFEVTYEAGGSSRGQTLRKTALRTGPGTQYAEVKTVSSGYGFDCLDCIDGWYMLRYSDSSTGGEVFVYVDSSDAQVSGTYGGYAGAEG